MFGVRMCDYCCQCLIVVRVLNFFFVKQKTAYEMRMSDWSSDVCSSDLQPSSATAFLCRYSPDTCSPRTWISPCSPGAQQEPSSRRISSSMLDRKRVVSGKSVSVRVDLVGRRIIKQNQLTVERSTSIHQRTMTIIYCTFPVRQSHL